MIGILSGMGAAAGSRVLKLLIKECQRRGAKEDSDYPEILLYNLPAEGMNAKGIADENRIRTELKSGVDLLNKAGCRLIIIACNTVHIYREMLQRASDALILDMPAAAVRACKGCKKVGLLTSNTMRQTELYDQMLKKMLGAIPVHISDFEQGAIDLTIGRIIAGNWEGRHEYAMQSIINDLLDDGGAEKVILGCTELPLLPLVFPAGVLVDPAQHIIEEALDL